MNKKLVIFLILLIIYLIYSFAYILNFINLDFSKPPINYDDRIYGSLLMMTAPIYTCLIGFILFKFNKIPLIIITAIIMFSIIDLSTYLI